MSDHYQTLGLAPNATIGEIEDAYAMLAESLHPSKHEDNSLAELAAEKLKNVEQAYRVLRDTRLRAEYDRALGFRPPRQEPTFSGEFFRALKRHAPSLIMKLVWVGLTFAYARIVKNPRVIIVTAVILAALWLIKRRRNR
jgi:curved DNA-binding protein CbpA